jgi:exodeoxyribonuclease V alpha subunit
MIRSEAILQQLLAARLIGPLDRHFARFLLRAVETEDEGLALAAALSSAARREGHVCLDLAGIAGTRLSEGAPSAYRLPPLDSWRKALLSSGAVGRPGEGQPLILDQSDRLYLNRYWDYEQRVGRSLLRRAGKAVEGVDEPALARDLASLFEPMSGADQVNWQKLAAATAVLQPFAVISGGPGTGKTTTVVKLLALLRQQPNGDRLRIALAAPTGMAASRLQQSISNSKRTLPLPEEILAEIPDQSVTLHRLLGVVGGGTGFLHHRENPLPLDLLVLDEASMVDVSLMAHLLDALPETARLILLGDRDQLASVEAGAVLGDICQDCEGAGSDFTRKLQELTGEPLEPGKAAGRLRDQVVVLRHSYRFGSDSAIGRLAEAVNRGEAEQAKQLLLREEGSEQIEWKQADTAAYAAHRYAALFDQLNAGVPVEELFEGLRAFRVLCALRSGPQGMEQMNREISRHLARQGKLALDSEWFPGRPVMVTRNDYALGLYNGDMGLVCPHPEERDQLAVAFPGSDAETRWIAPARLSTCETVYAMTVHKSQGSEFQEVLLQLPHQTSPVLCRELIYTAVTRARQRFILSGPEAVFQPAVERSLERHSGLVDLLREGNENAALQQDSCK